MRSEGKAFQDRFDTLFSEDIASCHYMHIHTGPVLTRDWTGLFGEREMWNCFIRR